MIDRILVPLDGSDLAAQTVPHAALQARRFEARILLLRVVEPLPASSMELVTTPELFPVEENVESYLEGVANVVAGEGLSVDFYTRLGPAAESIIAFAKTEDVDLIAMSTHGRSGIGRWVYGSVADKVLRGADVPVFLIRASEDAQREEASGYRRLLVPLDGSDLAELALPYAETWSKAFDAEVILLRVPTLPAYVSLGPDASMLVPSLLSEAYEEADAYLANVTRRLNAKGLDVHRAAVEPGPIADTIIDYAHEADVDFIVMSTHGRSGLGRWVYGSVADRVLRGAGIPVLLVRAPRAQLSGHDQ
ncbi:MAG: universal stress protein [Anaerolineae bacterium]